MTAAETEMAELVRTYIDAFNRADYEKCLTCYLLPFSFVTRRGPIVLKDRESFFHGMNDSTQRLKEKGYSHSELEEINVREFDENVGMASNIVVRMKTDGTIMEKLGGTYSLQRQADGWKLAAVLLHPADRVIRF